MALAGNPQAGLRAGPGRSGSAPCEFLQERAPMLSLHALWPLVCHCPQHSPCFWFPVPLLRSSCITVFIQGPGAQPKASARECRLIKVSHADPLSTHNQPAPPLTSISSCPEAGPGTKPALPRGWSVPLLHLLSTVAPQFVSPALTTTRELLLK